MVRQVLNNQQGVTLFETLVAAIMSGILLAAALPSLSTALNANALKASIRSTSNYVRQVRSVAVSRNTQTRLVVGNNGTKLTTQALNGAVWNDVGSPLVLTSGVRVQSVSPTSGLLFNAQGTTNAATTLTLATPAGGSKTVTISLLGNVQES